MLQALSLVWTGVCTTGQFYLSQNFDWSPKTKGHRLLRYCHSQLGLSWSLLSTELISAQACLWIPTLIGNKRLEFTDRRGWFCCVLGLEFPFLPLPAKLMREGFHLKISTEFQAAFVQSCRNSRALLGSWSKNTWGKVNLRNVMASLGCQLDYIWN